MADAPSNADAPRDLVRYDLADDGVLTLTIDRPDKLNALSLDVMDALDAAFTAAETDPAVKAVVLTGSGPKAFVAGADIQQFTALNGAKGEGFSRRGQAVFARIERLPKVVIAAVNGYALGGGCELALACHLRIAATNAVFGQPEVNLGLIAGYGGTQRLPAIVGRGVALELLLTGAPIKAERAYEIGLVNRVVAPEALMDEAVAMARLIASKAPLAVAYTLRATLGTDTSGFAHEATLFGLAAATDDVQEGASAFLAKRPPAFQGR